MSCREPLDTETVRHIARLARLRLTAEELESYRTQLARVLDHVSRLAELDLANVEPMARSVAAVNRFDDDQVGKALDVEKLLRNAPKTQDRYFAVPKVLDGDGGGQSA